MLKEREHALFVRKGPHLFMKKDIPLVNALTGLEFAIPLLDGRHLVVKTEPGEVVAPDALREVRNEGMPLAGRPYEHGNLYIEFHLLFPERIAATHLDALRKALPQGLAAPTIPPGAETAQANLTPADPEHISFDEGRGHGGAHEESDEDDGQPQGVQCAQQ